MSENQGGETQPSFQAREEARKAETRANLVNAIWTGLGHGLYKGAQLLYSLFLEKGGSHDEFMAGKPEEIDETGLPKPPQST